MVYVPAGEFLMGSTEAEIAAVFRGASGHVAGVTKEGLACETPQRKVYLDGYWIYKNDVTVGEYRNFCLATGREMPDAPAWGWKDDHPMVNVTWNDAKAYCDWAGAALPTEAQWEKAARGGDVRNYPWGFTWDAGKLWCSVGEKRMSTAAVGRYPAGASPYGCLDMVGNVNQWCADWYDDSYYRKGENHNPPGAETGQMRVLRGGSWNKDATFYLRCAIRSAGIPNFRYLSYFGFRCVVPVGSP
jgi:formylglycine-generating enzyme required for sulfatase activity